MESKEGKSIQCRRVGVGCLATFPSDTERELHEHNECGWRPVPCGMRLCSTVVEARHLKTHFETCPHIPILCPNGCDEPLTAALTRATLETHRSMCPLEPVSCPFWHSFGCKTRTTRKAMSVHVHDYILHQQLALAKIASLEQSLESCVPSTPPGGPHLHSTPKAVPIPISDSKEIKVQSSEVKEKKTRKKSEWLIAPAQPMDPSPSVGTLADWERDTFRILRHEILSSLAYFSVGFKQEHLAPLCVVSPLKMDGERNEKTMDSETSRGVKVDTPCRFSIHVMWMGRRVPVTGCLFCVDFTLDDCTWKPRVHVEDHKNGHYEAVWSATRPGKCIIRVSLGAATLTPTLHVNILP